MSIRVERERRHAAIAIGGAGVSLMRTEAVETAAMLTSSTRFGGTSGLSPKVIQRITEHALLNEDKGIMEPVPSPVVIVPYDPSWPEVYETEATILRRCLGGVVRSMEHVGSTAVPGLPAKPIIDILAGVDGRPDAERCKEALVPVGYEDASAGDDPDWYWCLGKGPHSPGYHLHLVREGSAFQRRHVVFRDWLQAHQEVAEDYAQLKMRLAETYRNDRSAYTAGKTAFIEGILKKAEIRLS